MLTVSEIIETTHHTLFGGILLKRGVANCRDEAYSLASVLFHHEKIKRVPFNGVDAPIDVVAQTIKATLQKILRRDPLTISMNEPSKEIYQALKEKGLVE